MSVENTGSHLYSARRQTTLGKTFLVYILSGRVETLLGNVLILRKVGVRHFYTGRLI